MKLTYKLMLAGVAVMLAAGCSNSGSPNVPLVAGGASQSGGQKPNIAGMQSWRAAIAHAPTPGNGCYTAAYPVTTWIKVRVRACAKSSLHSAKRLGRLVDRWRRQ